MGTTRLDALPKDVRKEELYPRSPLSTLGLLAQTSKQYEEETTLLRLLAAAIHAAPAFMDAKENETALAAIALLKKHPELLFKKMKVIDHYGREIWASPYKIFLGAGDIWAIRQIEVDILPLVKNGEEQAKAQFKEQFPHYDKKLDDSMDKDTRFYDDRNKQQIEDIVKQLATVKHLIEVDPLNNNQPLDATKLALEILYKLLQPTPEEIIRSGLHFPIAIMNEMYKAYYALQSHFSYFSLAVIKPALSALSTVDGQCCLYGLKYLDMEKGPGRRCHSSYQHPLGQPLSLRFVNDKERDLAVSVDPYDGEVYFVSSTLGFFDCFNKNGGQSRLGNGCIWCGSGHVARCWEKLWRTKVDALESHYAAIQRSQHTVTINMKNA